MLLDIYICLIEFRLSVIDNPISHRLRGTIKITGLSEDVNFSSKFPEASLKYEDVQSLHEVMPSISQILSFLDGHGYKLVSSTNVTGFHSGETFIIWNLSIP